jgi:hypothetical protein
MDKELLDNIEISNLVQSIAEEFANQNLFALRDFHIFVFDSPNTDLEKNCSKLYSVVHGFINQGDSFLQLCNLEPMPRWVAHALFFGKNKGTYDLQIVARQLCASLIQQRSLGLDDHVKNLSNRYLFDEVGINTDNDFLINLSDKRFEIRNNGIIFDSKVLIYPHQFLRRFYSSGFVNIPALLSKALQLGLSVYIRIDPLRKTTPEHYREIMELDYWHGPKFSRDMLKDLYLNNRTVYTSRGVYCLNYDARFTVFRTKMMDKGMREFMIEEYCPLELPGLCIDFKSPGVGDIFYVQKFAHVCYNQKQNCFTHLDGAVRVFNKEEYLNYFKEIEAGRDVDEKIGTRYKMFLIEGEITDVLAQEVLTEWFRYNVHIQEYFSSENIEPMITYEKLNQNK